ncbi:DUF6461 domain-containing protein [Streptosporangium sandarakinum]|uniref:DUF6461 domain-containing protein n=1 Tax=Streptosporangium sandarakinum TaxID=1260955 RepID=UPI0036A56B15
MRLYDLLFSYAEQYDDEEMPFEQFAALWCEGRDPRASAALLGADLGSAYPCTLAQIGENLHIQSDDGVILTGPAGEWSLVIQVEGHSAVLDENLVRLSENGHRALSVSWDIGGNEEICYAVNGEMLVRFSFTFPDLRSGTDVTVLDPLMDGLRFQLDENGESIEESISSAFTLAGRLTGKEIDADWLNARHERFIIPSGD